MTIRTRRTTAAAMMARLHGQAFDEPWRQADFRTLLASPGVFALLAEDSGGAPLGFVLARVAADEAEILTLAVGPQHRRRGVGRKLVEAAAARARETGAAALFLEVAADNAAAIALYGASGFHRAGVRAGYYARGKTRVDALALRRALNRT